MKTYRKYKWKKCDKFLLNLFFLIFLKIRMHAWEVYDVIHSNICCKSHFHNDFR